jgi:hypothetical protein
MLISSGVKKNKTRREDGLSLVRKIINLGGVMGETRSSIRKEVGPADLVGGIMSK